MAEYIDANALQAQLERKKVGIANQRYTEGWNDCMMRVKSMVSKAPAADVAPVVHGRWISNCVGSPAFFVCDQCNTAWYNDTKFCPNCGAKMDGGANNG